MQLRVFAGCFFHEVCEGAGAFLALPVQDCDQNTNAVVSCEPPWVLVYEPPGPVARPAPGVWQIKLTEFGKTYLFMSLSSVLRVGFLGPKARGA